MLPIYMIQGHEIVLALGGVDGELKVSQPKTSNSIRTIPIPKQAVDLLILEHEKHPDNPYLFPSPKTGTMYDRIPSGILTRRSWRRQG